MQPKIETFRRAVLEDPAVESMAGFIGGGARHQQRADVRAPQAAAERKVSAQVVVERIRRNLPPRARRADCA